MTMSWNELSAKFEKPGIEWSPIPFWFLNADFDKEQLARQLRMMKASGIGAVVLHARRGHSAKYLSDEWLAEIRFCVETCAELGMKAWLYDEDNWPSGYAGGKTLEKYPAGQCKHLAMRPAGQTQADGTAGEIVASFDGYDFVMDLTPWHPAYAEGFYIDLMDPQAIAAFIEVTHEAYSATLDEYMGTTVTAIFTDEPGFYNHFYDCAPGTVIWTPDMAVEFEKRCGYDLLPKLRGLFEDTEDCAQLRCDFYGVVSELMDERFYSPLKTWSNAHNIMLVGHVNNEEYLVDHVRLNADFFTAMDGLDFPGMDLIGGRGDYRRAPDSIAPKLTSSAAHTRNKRQALSECFGAMGWDLTVEEMRRMTDWQFVRGITILTPHAYYQSIEGDRYHECPPSLFYQSAHWPEIVGLTGYQTRCRFLLENSRPASNVAVYYPIDAVREVTSPAAPPSLGHGMDEMAAEAGRLGVAFRALTDGLMRQQVEFDIVDDRALASAVCKDGLLCIEDLKYKCIIIPFGATPEIVQQAQAKGVQVITGCDEKTLGQAVQFTGVKIAPSCDQITVSWRKLADADLFLIVNEGQERYEGFATLPVKGSLQLCDAATGSIENWPCETCEDGVKVALDLLPGSAMWFTVSK